MDIAFSLDEISTLVSPSAIRGQTHERVRGIASLAGAKPGDLSFLGNAKYKADVAGSEASVVLLPPDYIGEPKENQVFVIVAKPSAALALLCARIEQLLWPKPAPGVHASAVVDAKAKVAASATIGPLCVIEEGAVIGEGVYLQARVFVGRNARIGDDSWLMAGATVATECVLGKRVRMQAGAVVGSDGFGYEFINGRHVKVPQVGNVVLGDDVEIGANAAIDRARFSQTVIGTGSKIDNLVQIGHNVVIGNHVIVCGQAGISGSTTLEDYVIVGGQAGLAGHLTVGKGAKIDAQSGINSDLEPGSFVKGSPCLPYNLEQRFNVLKKKLPDLFKRVSELEGEVKK